MYAHIYNVRCLHNACRRILTADPLGANKNRLQSPVANGRVIVLAVSCGCPTAATPFAANPGLLPPEIDHTLR